MQRVTTKAGRAQIEAREARRRKAYRDIKGNWTIGIGHTSMAGTPHVGPGLVITDAQMDEIFARDLMQYEAAVRRYVKVPLADHQFDACVSFTYNAGAGGFSRSRFLKYLNCRAWDDAARALVADAEEALKGRRRSEAAQFLTPYHETPILVRSNVGGGLDVSAPPVVIDRLRSAVAVRDPHARVPEVVATTPVIAPPAAPPSALPLASALREVVKSILALCRRQR